MFTVDDFISQYEAYTDEELSHMQANIEGYSDEAQEALKKVIRKKGGQEALIARLEEQQKMQQENNRIISHRQAQLDKEDRKIKPRTIIGSITGTILASVIGGGLSGLEMIYAHKEMPEKIIIVLFTGLILLCYGIIQLCTRQSKKNRVVLIATIISVALSIGIGQAIYNIAGPK